MFGDSASFFDISIGNISEAIAETPINHTFFCKSVMRTFRCIYVNCLDRLRSFAEISTKLKKNALFLTI